MLVPRIHLWSTRNSPSVRKGSWPAVAAECFVTFFVDCGASEQWKTVSDWTVQPLMESTMTIEPWVTRRAEVTPEGRKHRRTGCLRRDCRHTVTPQRLSERRTRLPRLDLQRHLESDVLLACAATRSRSHRSDVNESYGCRDSA